MQVELTGKITKQAFHNGTHTTLLMTPAADAYSQPSTYKLKSDNALGNEGDEVTATCEMRGFVRNKQYRDKNTGQPKEFDEDNVIFSVKAVRPAKQPAAVKSA